MFYVNVSSDAANQPGRWAFFPPLHRWEDRPSSRVCSKLSEAKAWSRHPSLLGAAGGGGDAGLRAQAQCSLSHPPRMWASCVCPRESGAGSPISGHAGLGPDAGTSDSAGAASLGGSAGPGASPWESPKSAARTTVMAGHGVGFAAQGAYTVP